MRHGIFHCVALALVLAACGGTDTGAEGGPCGDPPMCDEGLVCLSNLCVRPADAGVDATPGPDAFECNDDLAYEPNDEQLLATDVGNLPAAFPALSLCPSEDIDYFETLLESGQDLFLEVRSATVDDLELTMLDNSGVIDFGEVVEPGLLRAEYYNLPFGAYYAEVKSRDGELVNYSLTVRVEGP